MDKSERFDEFRRQSKKGILVIYINQIYALLKAIWILLFLFIQRFSKFSEVSLTYIYSAFAIVLFFFLIRAFLVFKNFQFKIANNHFVLKKGILKKTNTSIPFDRIQNINFKQNIIQQIINVYEVNIETAGSSKAEISIKAMSLQQANALKKSIAVFDKKVDNFEIEIEEKPLLKVGVLELIKVSLTENHFQSLILLLAVLLGFYQQLNEILNGFGKSEMIDNFITENTSAFQASLILILVSVLLLTLVAILSSFVRIFLMHFNLTVFIKNNALEIDQGLTTKKSVVLKKSKVQHITISTNPIKKRLGISFINFAQAISGKIKKKQNKIIKIVGCKAIQIAAIKRFIFQDESFEDYDINYSEPYYRNRMYFIASILLILINLGLYFGFENNVIFGINTILVPLFILIIQLKFRKRTYMFSEDLLLIGSGAVETHQTYLPFYKIQNIKLQQSIFQERKNIANLIFQTASGKIKIPCIQKSKALQIYNYTLFKVETSKKSWM